MIDPYPYDEDFRSVDLYQDNLPNFIDFSTRNEVL